MLPRGLQIVSRAIILRRPGTRQFSQKAPPKPSTLFVGGLSYDTNEAAVKDAFGRHGEVIGVNVVCDRSSGRSKGFGFVKFAEEDGAKKALQEMDGQLLDGRNIRVETVKNSGLREG